MLKLARFAVSLLILTALGSSLAAQSEPTEPEAETEESRTAEESWKFRWKDSFRLTSPDGEISLKFGGRIQNDWAFYSADDELEAAVGALVDGTEFRRARLFFEGTLWDKVEFKTQYDFAGGDVDFRDVYLGLIHLPAVGGVRVGHYKEPFSLEELTSSKYITFLERATPIEAFSPSRNSGVMIGQGAGGERWQWKLGLFKDVDDFGSRLGDEWNVTGRLSGLPWYEEEGRRLFHLGLSASRRSPNDDRVRFRSRPESHLAPRFVDTGTFAADGVTLLSLEAALVAGPFSAQAEMLRTSVDALAGPDPDFSGHYIYVSYFLTGENRRYKPSAGAFDRLRPARDLSHGHGAWELALRYSDLDLDDGGIRGGQVSDLTFAVNGYLYSNVRVMLDYVLSDLDGGGEAEIFEARFQIDF